MTDFLWLTIASLPAGVVLFTWAEWLWLRIERGLVDRDSTNPLTQNPMGESCDESILP